ncbi:MAG: hypothetical protein JRF04_01550 [Deltaproteobacteria bacterium]|nr:hypothetical protein [Deltaproteobacteria bacterium]
MELFNTIPFTFEEENFEIRIFYDNVTINVVSFLNDYPANGYRYQIKIPTEWNVEKLLKHYPVPELVEKCKNDIRENKWGAFLDVVKKNKIN